MKKKNYTYSTSTMTLADGKRMSICLPYPMNAADFEILDKCIALQKEAMEREPEGEQVANSTHDLAHNPNSTT